MVRSARDPARCVLCWNVEGHAFGAAHEQATRAEVAKRLAVLKRFEFGGEYLPAHGRTPSCYLVPSDTLHADAARQHGIHGPEDLFGGVVPHLFVATKAITHPLIDATAARPEGWVDRLGEALSAVTLAGFTAFTPDDARRAGHRLLAQGAVRIKPARSVGGKNQHVVTDERQLTRCLGTLDPEELCTHGVVLEENLHAPVVHSVGQIRVGDLVASYHGVQRETRDNRDQPAYGGSDLRVVRGDFERLLRLRLKPDVRLAVGQARVYHQAVVECYPGFFASRINYDVAQGRNARGEPRSGVLEQSWRIGGATGAEIAALEAFRARPDCHLVDASCVEAYGGVAPPPRSTVYFHGDDPEIGPIAKYAFVHPDADPT